MRATQAIPPVTPPRRGQDAQGGSETLTFSTPSAQLHDTNPLYDDVNERILWSPFNSSFSSDCEQGGRACGGRVRPDLAARHAAAAARFAAMAARHAEAAAKYAGLRVHDTPAATRRRTHAGHGKPSAPSPP